MKVDRFEDLFAWQKAKTEKSKMILIAHCSLLL